VFGKPLQLSSVRPEQNLVKLISGSTFKKRILTFMPSCKELPGTNTLAYLASPSVTNEKKVAPGRRWRWRRPRRSCSSRFRVEPETATFAETGVSKNWVMSKFVEFLSLSYQLEPGMARSLNEANRAPSTTRWCYQSQV